MEELIRDTDRVYHMASAVGVRLIMERPVQDDRDDLSRHGCRARILLAISQTRADPEHVRGLWQRRLGAL